MIPSTSSIGDKFPFKEGFDVYTCKNVQELRALGDIKGCVAITRDADTKGILHMIFYIAQVIHRFFLSFFRDTSNFDAKLCHGLVLMGWDAHKDREDRIVVAHAVFSGIKTGSRNYFNDYDVTELVVYKPRDPKLRDLIVRNANQTASKEGVHNNLPNIAQHTELAPKPLETPYISILEDGLPSEISAPQNNNVPKHSELSPKPTESPYLSNPEDVKPLESKQQLDRGPTSLEDDMNGDNCEGGCRIRKADFSIIDLAMSLFQRPDAEPTKKMQRRLAIAVADLVVGGQIFKEMGEESKPQEYFCIPYMTVILQSSMLMNKLSEEEVATLKGIADREERIQAIFNRIKEPIANDPVSEVYWANRVCQLDARYVMGAYFGEQMPVPQEVKIAESDEVPTAVGFDGKKSLELTRPPSLNNNGNIIVMHPIPLV